jgi:serine O-acetyltransferase
VLIGANAVVLIDVPDNCIAVGVPAIIKPRRL